MKPKIAFCCTFPNIHFNLYGKQFLKSYAKHCNLPLFCYIDGMEKDDYLKYSNLPSNINILNYEKNCIDREKFLSTLPIIDNESKKGIYGDISKQIVRWSFKGFAQISFFKKYHKKFNFIGYIDSDCVICDDLNDKFFLETLPESRLMSCIDRSDINKFTESGFIIWNCNDELLKKWFFRYEEYWQKHLYISLKEWHDCEIIDAIKNELNLILNKKILNLAGSGLHAFETGILGRYIDHKKGFRKFLGFSFERVSKNEFFLFFSAFFYKYISKFLKLSGNFFNIKY